MIMVKKHDMGKKGKNVTVEVLESSKSMNLKVYVNYVQRWIIYTLLTAHRNLAKKYYNIR